MLRLLMLAMILAGVAACSARSGSRAAGADCMAAPQPVAFGAVFGDSARAAAVLLPLLDAASDTVYLAVGFGPRVFVDTVTVPDSTARADIEGRLEALARPVDPVTIRELELTRDPAGAPRFSAESGRMCAPELKNRSELARALRRAQTVIQSNGTVVLWILIDESGTPTRVDVNHSSGNANIDAAAVGVGYVARFDPAMRAGEPVRVWIQLPVEFRW